MYILCQRLVQALGTGVHTGTAPTHIGTLLSKYGSSHCHPLLEPSRRVTGNLIQYFKSLSSVPQ